MKQKKSSTHVARMLRDVADELDTAEALRLEIERLRDVDSAGQAACTAYLFREEQPERFSEAMAQLYKVTRQDLWEESHKGRLVR
jgi:hypothetical protein